MSFLLLVIRFGVGTLFLSAGFSKIKNFEEHIAIVKDYKIIEKRLVNIFVKMEIFLEIIVGFLILLGLLQTIMGIVSIFLLFGYTIAILINLLRGRKEISCGCGGIVGNHTLSWFLVFRNLCILGVILLFIRFHTELGSIDGLLRGYGVVEIINMQVFLALFSFWTTTVLIIVIRHLWNFYKMIRNLYN